MACSDDEGEVLLPKVVSDYSFLDDNNEPVSFSELPLIWDSDDDDGERLEGSRKEMGLLGTTDNGLQKIFERVVAWKFDISSAKPEIFVLSKKKNWIKLLKPRRAFEEEIWTILITVHCLHFLKRNPRTSGKDLWDHLTKVFRLFDPKPSENDLVDHMNLIGEAVKRDETLARSKLLVTFLRKKPQKSEFTNEEVGTKKMSSFVVPDHVTDKKGEEDSSSEEEEEEDYFENVCVICDNGGNLICCEGKCKRAFHATKEAGLDSSCESLRFSEEQVTALASFKCKNCKYKQHQCYICGKLGSSDKSTGAEVFQCRAETCGHFYHPHCVAKAIRVEYGDRRKDLEDKIAVGEPFMCPLHVCHACKKREAKDTNDLQMQFAVCRRCPRAYHRKCLPRKIGFEDDEDKNIVQRAWEDLLPNKILIYCLKHEMADELQTAIRNHIKFPNTHQKKKELNLGSVCRDKSVPKKKVDAAEDATGKKVVAKQSRGTDKLFARKRAADSSTGEDRLSIPKPFKKQKLEHNVKVADSGVESRTSLENQQNEPEPKGEISDLNQQRETGKPVAIEVEDDSMELDADSKNKILSILREAESSMKLEDVVQKNQAPFSSKRVMQNMKLGKTEGGVEALRRPVVLLDLVGFATGPYRPSSQQNSSGWIYE